MPRHVILENDTHRIVKQDGYTASNLVHRYYIAVKYYLVRKGPFNVGTEVWEGRLTKEGKAAIQKALELQEKSA